MSNSYSVVVTYIPEMQGSEVFWGWEAIIYESGSTKVVSKLSSEISFRHKPSSKGNARVVTENYIRALDAEDNVEVMDITV